MKKHRPATATSRLHSEQEGCHSRGMPQAEHDKHEVRVASHQLRVEAEEVTQRLRREMFLNPGGWTALVLGQAVMLIERLLAERIPAKVESEARDE